MGLGPQSSTVFNSLVAAGNIDAPLFGFALGGSGGKSEIRFGGINWDRVQKGATFQWSNLINEDYWTLGLQGVKYDGANVYTQWTNQLIVDSGTTLLAMEGTDFNNFINKVAAERKGLEQTQQGIFLWEGKCEPLSDIELTVNGGVTLSIPSNEWLEEIQTYCVVRVQSTGFAGFYIGGDVLMRNYYTVFDHGNKRVGFAPIKKDSAEEKSTDFLDDLEEKVEKVGDDIKKIIDDINGRFEEGIKKLF
eukprot:NODE_1021_length_1318_cov_69.520095_g841_i0.p1 GENE.NODE_1021_length_1318_cov_69.520095_g841_i0~~NODE_1021_length_1318_cov_69.520095_g841_i0.p1  ORF type:complete len:248 (+),score=71.67 NODE_1021_length_1318_cov_69.520095_g841_i0:506-1249(+)